MTDDEDKPGRPASEHPPDVLDQVDEIVRKSNKVEETSTWTRNLGITAIVVATAIVVLESMLGPYRGTRILILGFSLILLGALFVANWFRNRE